MPGNEVGDRVHNFFGQENLSQSQHYSQSIDGNWSGINNNLWVGVQKQIGGPFISSLKNYNLQQSDQERVHGSQTSHVSHGLNFTQSNLKPEFGRVQTLNQQPALNGYVHGNHVIQGRQNETKFLGVDTNQHDLAARGLSISQQENAPEHSKTNSMRLDASESPVNFDFFEGQQQMSGQHLNVLQSMLKQQPGNNDVQLLQRQMMLQQLQELYRQQQLQEIEPRQQSFMNQVSTVAKQTAGNHSPSLINGVPVNEASNSLWQPELMAGGSWLQRGASQFMQGLPSGHMFSPENGQALRLMDMVPQQADQSLYGVPISGTSGGPSSYSLVQMEKPAMQQISANNNSLSGSPYTSFPDRVSMQEETRPDFGPVTGQGLSSGFNLESMQHDKHPEISLSMQEFQGRQEAAESPEPLQEKSFNQTISHSAATLDPTEEKILFGSDDNIWEAFGKSTNMGIGGYNMMDGADYSGGLSSLQSGSWSALMQSAVAETSNGETGIQEEWCGPSIQNSEALTGNQQISSVNHDVKPQGVWGGNNFQPPIAQSLRPSPIPAEANRPNSGVSSFGALQFQQSEFKTSSVQGEMLNTDSSQRLIPKFAGQGSKWPDRGSLQKQSVEHSHTYTNVSHPSSTETNANNNSGSWIRQHSTSTHGSDAHPYHRPNGWSFVSSSAADDGDNLRTPVSKNSLQPALNGEQKRGMHEELGHVSGMWRADFAPNSNAELEPAKPSMGSPLVGRNASSLNNIAVANSTSVRPNQVGEQQVPNSDKLKFWKIIDSSTSSKRAEILGKSQHNLCMSPQILDSSGNCSLDGGVVETHEMDTNSKKDYSADGSHSSILHSAGGSKDNNWSDAGDSHTFSGGKQKSSGNIGRKLPGTRKFQYHPMGDVDIDHEPSYGAKNVSQTSPKQIARGLKMYDHGSFGQSNFGGNMDNTSSALEKGHLSVGQADTKDLDAMLPKSMFPGFAPNSSTPFDRGISNHASNKVPPSSQHMLELLHKVDHQRDHGSAAHLSSSERNLSSEMPETETSDGSVGHVERNQSSSSQNFGLQLAPPSQRLSSTDRGVSSQRSQQAVFGSTHATLEAGEKGHMHPASRASTVPFPSSYKPSQGNGHSIAVSSAQIVNKAPYSNVQGGYSTALPSGFPYARNLETQHMHDASGQITANPSVHVPFYRISSGSKQLDGSSERAHSSQYILSSGPNLSASALQDKLVSSAETTQLSRTDQIPVPDPAQQILEPDGSPATQPSVQQGTFSKMLPNSWTSVPRDQASLAAESSKAASSLSKYEPQSNDSLVMTFPGPSKLNVQDVVEGRNGLSSAGVVLANSRSFTAKEQPDREICQPQVLAGKVETAQKTLSLSQGNESVVNNFSEASFASHAATQRDIEAFGRSLRPNSSHQTYSLLHQVQAMKSTEFDSTDRSTKRLKGSDHVMDRQQVGPVGGRHLSHGYGSIARDSSSNHSSVPSGDLNVLSFSSKARDAQDSNASSQDTFAFSHKSTNDIPGGRDNATSTRSEHPQISPRMAPSWFEQYGTFKNGQMLQVSDMRITSAMKPVEQPFVVGKVADDLHARDLSEQGDIAADFHKLGIIQEVSAPSSAPGEHLTSPQLLRDPTEQDLAVERPKKRKSATSELVPWHKEIISASQRLQTISVAEVKWAKAANRQAEKVEEEIEMVDDAVPGFKPRRRLVLTTQLMQQLLRPPPTGIISSDADAQYESTAYFSARLALGDACSCSEPEAPLPGENKHTLSENLKTPKAVDQHLSKVVEDFIGRARRLESELLRLDKRASILDLKVECQDLEKFSVINRFAKFHGRGQPDGAEADGTLKSCPQRHVNPLPMPRNPLDGVQCLSL